MSSPDLLRALLRWFLPVAEVCARVGSQGSASEARLMRVRRQFVELNNRLVLNSGIVCVPGELLVLLPHCLQQSVCERRLTHNLGNCRRCGRCVVGDLLHMGEELGVTVAVAVGGTIARRIVREAHPRIIVAVACERDLASGIQDTAPLPVYGVANQRPCGDCLNTTVNVEAVARAVRLFLDG